jgi:hypothetical protein
LTIISLICTAATTFIIIFPLYAQEEILVSPQSIGVKITSHATGQKVSVINNSSNNNNLTISGTSTDDALTDCQVSVIVNNVKPYQPTVANSSGEKDDYSRWNFLLNSSYAFINEGPNNKITAKILCPPNLTKWYSVNVTGVAPPPTPSSDGFTAPLQQLVQDSSANITSTTTGNTLFNVSMLNITSPVSGQELPIGDTITIFGTSMDDFYKNCIVYAKKNNLPFKMVSAAGLTGAAGDYSAWKFTNTDDNALVTPGDTNNLTAKITCSNYSKSSSSISNNSANTATAYANVKVIGINQPPIAVAQMDNEEKEVNEGEEVILSGEDSNDPNGDSLTYAWKQTSDLLDDIDIINPNQEVSIFKVPDDLSKDTTFTFELTVRDSYGDTSTDTISIDAIGNSKPVADVGEDIEAVRGEQVVLDGTDSYDPDPTGKIISYVWEASGGSGNDDDHYDDIYLQDNNQPIAKFAVPFVQKDTTFEFTLKVVDDEGAEDDRSMKVEVEGNSKPVADAGSNKKAVIREQVTLDGAGSNDPDPTGEIVSYNWEQTDGLPSVNLNDTDKATPWFTVPNLEEDTTFEFTLTVTDNEGAEDEDIVEVEIEAPPKPQVSDGSDEIEPISQLQQPTVPSNNTLHNEQKLHNIDKQHPGK